MAGKEQQKFREVGSVAGEVLTSMRTVKSYNTETEELSRFGQIVHSGKKLAMRKNFILAALGSFNNSFVLMLFSFVVAGGAYLMRYEGLSPGFLIGAIFSAMLGVYSFVCTFSIVGDITSAISCCSNLLALMKLNPLIDPDSKRDTRVDNLEGDIVFKDVSFSYPTRRNVKVLKGINLTIPRGKTVALVGPSGSGKSTILSLILRFFDADAGEISIGTNHIRYINVQDLRRKIGVVSQEPVLFDGTVEDNIHYGNLESSPDEIKFAAQMANAHGFIVNLPEAYKTVVGERGAMLSGGQKQRIAIARALIRRPNILLLDEATSALDSPSEKVVQQTLESVSAGRTTVVVAHRLTSIKHADLIYVMMDGRIAEKGNHDDLMKARGPYFMLYSQQNAYESSNILENDIIGDLDFVPPRKNSTDRRFSLNRVSYDRRGSALSTVSSVKSVRSVHSIADTTMDQVEQVGFVSQVAKMTNKWELLTVVLSSIALGFHIPVFGLFFFYGLLQVQRVGPIINPSSIYGLGVGNVIFALVVAAVSFLVYFSSSLATENVIERLRVDMFESLLRRPMQFFDNAISSPVQMVNVIIQSPGQLGNMIGAKAGSSIGAIVSVLTAIVISFIVSWQIAWIQFAFLVFTVVSNYLQVTMSYRIQSSRKGGERMSSQLASICFDNIKVVQYLSLQSFMLENYKRMNNVPLGDKWKRILILAFFYSIVTNISFFHAALNLQYGMVWQGDSRGTMNLCYMDGFIVQGTFSAISSAVLHLQDIGKSKPAVEESLSLINCQDDDESGKGDSPTLKGGIEFKNVHFSYPNMRNRTILKGFNLIVHPGQTVALVGPSGNGKSTILNLLERFYEPTKGVIAIDSIDAKKINVNHLRNSMALVTQEPLLFNTTIRDNILYGVKSLNKQVTDDELIRCCKQANIYDFINSLPERFDTQVGARGSRLSGGQKQRIAIARALIRNPTILLLDEATSALDTENEKEVQEALNMASKGRTTFMVAHRLSTVTNADLIVVVDNGVVKEKGSHSELINLKGKYFEMLNETIE